MTVTVKVANTKRPTAVSFADLNIGDSFRNAKTSTLEGVRFKTGPSQYLAMYESGNAPCTGNICFPNDFLCYKTNVSITVDGDE